MNVEVAEHHAGTTVVITSRNRRPAAQPISRVDYFRREPTGGTVFVKPVEEQLPAE